MDEKTIFNKIKEVMEQFVDDASSLKHAKLNTHIIDDLNLNSAWLVDFVIRLEDTFDIEILDDEVDYIQTLGDAVNLIKKKIDSPKAVFA